MTIPVDIFSGWSSQINFVRAGGVYTGTFATGDPDPIDNPVVCVVFNPINTAVAGAPSFISLGGVVGFFRAYHRFIDSFGSNFYLLVAMIPLRDGLPASTDLVLDWPQAYTESRTLKAMAFVATGVSPDSDDFGSGYVESGNGALVIDLPISGAVVTAHYNTDADDGHPSADIFFSESSPLFDGDMSSRGAYSAIAEVDFPALEITWTPAPFNPDDVLSSAFILAPISDAPPAEPTVTIQLIDDEYIPQLLLGSRLHLKEIVCAPQRGDAKKPGRPQNARVDCCDRVKP